jgi:hypothetical protein
LSVFQIWILTNFMEKYFTTNPFPFSVV